MPLHLYYGITWYHTSVQRSDISQDMSVYWPWMQTLRFWVTGQPLLFLIPPSLINSVVNKVWLLQTKDPIVTQNYLEAILKPWQSKLCFIGFFPSSGCENTQINTLQHENSAAKFSFVTNSNKRAPSMPCHFQFRRKRTNKLFPLGHLWQWAILCQLLLKAIHISGPKISFKIIIFCIHVAGCQL